MTLGFKFILWENRNFDFEKSSFKYVFSITINVSLWDCIGKGACIERMRAVKNYNTNTIKKETMGGEEELKHMEFSGLLKK